MKNFLIIILFFLSVNVNGQYETGHWFFGDHVGLDFTGGSPDPEHGSSMMTEEGCSSISTSCGDLVLYTDGETVWNANHQVMQNGTGLLGNFSSTQSGIIIPKPKDENIYYIFTVDEAYDGPSNYGMCYTKVDMRLDGGLGGIVTNEKNINLVQHASEKVTAVAAGDNEFIWVITLATNSGSSTAPYLNSENAALNTFFAFKVTSQGVDFNAVVSTVNINVYSGAGYMKVSPDGTKLAIANLNDESTYLLKFNKDTGKVTDPVLLSNPFDANDPYGLEFSPDSSKLYMSDRDSKLVQYDLNNDNNPVLIDSQQNYRSALQLGLDGKIYQPHTKTYMIGSEYLNVIEYPNKVGSACNYKYKAITLPAGMTVHQGLPPFIQSYFTQISFQNVTADVPSTFEINSNESISSADWNFGNGDTFTTYPDNPPDNGHTQVDYVFNSPGTYTVTVVLHMASGCGDITLQESITIPDSIEDHYFCVDRNTGQGEIYFHNFDEEVNTTLDSEDSFNVKYYISYTDALNRINELVDPYVTTLTTQEVYYVAENSSNSFSYIGKFKVIGTWKPEIHTVSSFDYCDDDADGFASFDLTQKIDEILGAQSSTLYTVNFYYSQTDAEMQINEITALENFVNNTPYNDTVWYNIVNLDTGCIATSSFDLHVYPLIQIDMKDEYILCEGETLTIEAPAGFENYEWTTGVSDQSIIVDEPGQYSITVYNGHGCSNTKTFNVVLSNSATVDFIQVNDFYDIEKNSFEVLVNGLGVYEFSLDGINYQESNIFEGLSPGTYIVFIADKNGCGMVEKEVDLLGAPQYFTPNGDGYNDFWQIVSVDKRPGTVVYIYDRYGKLLVQINSASPGWDGTINGHPAPDSDYWYIAKVKETDGSIREVKGHFSLKR